jgi:large subunit ribosomal protein L32e
LKEEKQNREKLIAKRRHEKQKKPKFHRQESWRYKRVKENWRQTGGIDNKIHKELKGWPSSPNSGYRGPKISRGLHPSAFREVRVFNPDDLNKVDPELEAITIAHTVGGRKRTEIVNRAKEKGIHIFNPREFKEPQEPETEKEKS